ncbi:MAG: ECF transporter S component [Oscillospiraceae bacterium]|jgi:uncharacterized membrane protein|nr:ECF transporter S component [Oscillospiraceae bacterium]
MNFNSKKPCNNSSFQICLSGIMSALVFVATSIRIDVPIGVSNAMLSLGNVMCITSALLLSPFLAGISSGIGSLIFDLVTPIYVFSAPFTFFSKFCMAFVCSKVSQKCLILNCSSFIKKRLSNEDRSNLFGAISGIVVFIFLRILKVFLFNSIVLHLDFFSNVALSSKNIFVTVINSILAVIFALPLTKILKKSLPVNF